MKKGENEAVQPKKPEDFAKAYQELCDEYGYRVVVSPAFQARDDGTWSVVLQHSVGELPKQNLTK